MPFSDRSRAIYRCLFRFALRAVITGSVVVAVCCCVLRIYAFYESRKAINLLEEATKIRVGAPEESVIPLVARFGGVKNLPSPPSSIDDCPDKAECEYQNDRLGEYTYGIVLSPFNVYPASVKQTRHLNRAVASLMVYIPSSLRDPLSFRDWIADVYIRIRSGHVEAVAGGLYVEGRSRWLGNSWELSADMPRLGMQGKTYVGEGTFLEMPTGGGAGTDQYLTPAATFEQFQAAQSFSERCLTDLVPCRCPSDLAPYAIRYLKEHPEMGSPIMNDDCPKVPYQGQK